MRTLLGALPLLAGLLATTPRIAAAAETYIVDAVHSTVIFRAKHAGVGWTYGMFRGISGTLKVDQRKPANSSVEIVVDAASVFTNNKQRDAHLRSPDFLNVKQYPKITFRGNGVRKTGGDFEVKGTLSLHGTSRSIAVRFSRVGAGKGPKGKQLIGFEATFSLRRSEYGMKNMIGPVSDVIELTVALEGVKK